MFALPIDEPCEPFTIRTADPGLDVLVDEWIARPDRHVMVIGDRANARTVAAHRRLLLRRGHTRHHLGARYPLVTQFADGADWPEDRFMRIHFYLATPRVTSFWVEECNCNQDPFVDNTDRKSLVFSCRQCKTVYRQVRAVSYARIQPDHLHKLITLARQKGITP